MDSEPSTIEKQVYRIISKEKINIYKYIPFGYVSFYSQQKNIDQKFDAENYVRHYSIISYLPSCFIYGFISPPSGKIISLSNEECKLINSHINKSNNHTIVPKNNIIFILVESMESWPLDSVCGHLYMPYLSSLIKSQHVLFCNSVSTQTRYGNSADGQMIEMTGLLPLTEGATCRLYGKNRYPNFAHFYNKSAIINPAPGTWQQSTVTYSYGFKQLIEAPRIDEWNDKKIIDEVMKFVKNNDSSFCVLAITISSHSPFEHGTKNTKYKANGMPDILSAYLNCLSYTDSCIENLMNYINSSKLSNNTSIIISSDHIIFRYADTEINNYAKKSGFSFESGNTRAPLIIYSPLIKDNIQISEKCFQMDIFPTILHLIGCEDYYWHGFGVNLFDEHARKNRKISEDEAFRISDLIISSDYFRRYLNLASDSCIRIPSSGN